MYTYDWKGIRPINFICTMGDFGFDKLCYSITELNIRKRIMLISFLHNEKFTKRIYV